MIILDDGGRARGQRPMLAVPMLRDVEPARDPDALARGDVVEKARQPRRPSRPTREPAVQADRHHLWGSPPLPPAPPGRPASRQCRPIDIILGARPPSA